MVYILCFLSDFHFSAFDVEGTISWGLGWPFLMAAPIVKDLSKNFWKIKTPIVVSWKQPEQVEL